VIKHPEGKEVDLINELEIIPENENSPQGISNYVFTNVLKSTSINMIDLRTGYIVAEFNFDHLLKYQRYHVDTRLS
jgi:glutamine cyclotransferase